MRIFITLLALASIKGHTVDLHEIAFSDIYRRALWGKNANGEGFSGGGALFEYTREYANFLQQFIADYKIRSVVDAGCGDWESTRFFNWDNIDYKGYDVVPFLIEKNQKCFAKPNIQFFHANFLTADLPPADLLLCKHVLQHLTNEDISNFLPQLKKYKYCLITNQVIPSTLSGDNSNTHIGGGQKLDLTKPPFNQHGIKVLNYPIESCMHQVLLIIPNNPNHFPDRRVSPPYMTGDAFRCFADYVFDETNEWLDPLKVQKGSTIFVKTDMLSQFFSRYHPLISEKYILISHNSDGAVSESFINYLNDDKIIAWFAQNTEIIHPKLFPIPIGLENRYCFYGDLAVIDQMKGQLKNSPKNKLLYLNCSIATYPTERNYVYSLFQNKPFCHVSNRIPYPNYLEELAESKFVLCPRGNGLDCHRTWEALYVGAIPIVKSSGLDPMFTDLPVLVVDDWNAITEEWLNRKYDEMKRRDYNYKKIFINYWLNLIQSKKP